MKFYTLALLGLAAGIFLSACGGDPAQAKAEAAGDNPADKDKKEEVAIPVEVADVISGDIEAAYRGTATLEAADEATVVAKTTGVVEQILVEEGEQVNTGPSPPPSSTRIGPLVVGTQRMPSGQPAATRSRRPASVP